MSPAEIAAIVLAGMGAGLINTVVGSGTLITFPTLIAFGVPPVTANVSNSIGLVPGSISGAIGYRRELAGQRRRILKLGLASFLGGVAGAALLLALPESAFAAIVPVLIVLGVLLVLAQPRISRWVARRHEAKGTAGDRPADGGWWVWPSILGTGVYGGYFGAAQGVLLMAVMGIGIDEDLQRLNGVKNVLAAIVNGVSGVVFVAVHFLVEPYVDWWIVLYIGVGAVIGAQIGAKVGRRLPPFGLRIVIVVVGVAAVVSFLVGS
ncbi:sulfite exporter TauE/SafE family protein [Nocardioides sp. CFH 31398]|uniref:sulfite exporter TauE/SafE family protein n=1 Tax=Nocardioides sp. CFH 31398 TaxID=2919579 RepID=UPI001F06D74F|nr:sulfite exporter TauE/SafE family protein [Nocardioides sp. CFH 31398]MCH1866789.1 sulfite exporter TauE/SafE family protein [Nocardioides sp. CFH 31398]